MSTEDEAQVQTPSAWVDPQATATRSGKMPTAPIDVQAGGAGTELLLRPGQAVSLVASSSERIVGMAELLQRLNVRSRSTIYDYMRKGLIKKPGTVGLRRIGWRSSYVDELVRTLGQPR